MQASESITTASGPRDSKLRTRVTADTGPWEIKSTFLLYFIHRSEIWLSDSIIGHVTSRGRSSINVEPFRDVAVNPTSTQCTECLMHINLPAVASLVRLVLLTLANNMCDRAVTIQ